MKKITLLMIMATSVIPYSSSWSSNVQTPLAVSSFQEMISRWHAVPSEKKHNTWREFYSQIEKRFDPRLRSDFSPAQRKVAEKLKKNFGEDFRPLISKINMDVSILDKPFSLWPKTKVKDDAQPGQIVLFLMEKIETK